MSKFTPKFSTRFARRAMGALVLSVGVMHAVQSQDAPAGAPDAAALASVLLPQPAVRPGQSATQLPDGSWLLLGGEEPDKAPVAGAVIVQRGGGATAAEIKLNKARSGHTATLLPDGEILVIGGVDATGAVVTGAEQFDPAGTQVQDRGDLGLIARTGHTATVLANSQLWISGGFDQHDHEVHEAGWRARAAGRACHARAD
ncbi:kelch repeat-containing protein [Massilia sp. TWR1-2-2]|uniref:kelch repeat-containing protein n=1 Tax=Massilia sp. TWR1-2-2 TaxID=2804584 RepID=UPI003CF557DD